MRHNLPKGQQSNFVLIRLYSGKMQTWQLLPRPFTSSKKTSMPRIFWNPAQDQLLREHYPVLGPTPTSALLNTSRRSVINRAHRLNLKAPYPKDRARPSFPPKSYSPAEKLLAEALLNLFRAL
jgi:hypothetical protein